MFRYAQKIMVTEYLALSPLSHIHLSIIMFYGYQIYYLHLSGTPDILPLEYATTVLQFFEQGETEY